MNGLRLDFNSSETVVQDISSPTRNRKKLPEQYPAFAAILSFLYHYALLLGCVGDIDIKRISQWFHNDTPIGEDLVDFVMNLLKRVGKKVSKDNWQDQLGSFFHRQNEWDSWMLKNNSNGFLKLTMNSRLNVIKYLLERQFDRNEKFRQLVETLPSEDMRILPVGSDEKGLIYWYFEDTHFNVLLYREEQDDHNEDSFTLLARSVEQFTCILTKLENRDFSLLDIKELKQTATTPKVEPQAQISESYLNRAEVEFPNGKVESQIENEITETLKLVSTNHEDEISKNTLEDPKLESIDISKEEPKMLAEGEIKEETMENAARTEAPSLEAFQLKQNVSKSEELNVKEETSAIEQKQSEAFEGNCETKNRAENESLNENGLKTPNKIETINCVYNSSKRGSPRTKIFNEVSTENQQISTEDYEKRRSSRLSRSAKTCYSVEDTFKLIYSQTQVTPPPKKRKLSAKNEDSLEKHEDNLVLNSNEASEDVPLAKIASSLEKKGNKSNKSKSKKGKKSKKKKKKEDSDDETEREDRSDSEDDEEVIYPGEEDYEGCKVCLKRSKPNTILLCDSCDSSFHMACLRPPLFVIPEQEWFCPSCCHEKLIVELRAILEAVQLQIANTNRRRKYVSSHVPFGFPSYVNFQQQQSLEEKQDFSHLFGHQMSPIAPGRSLREKKRVNYGYNDFDQEIKAAIRAHNSPMKGESVNGYSSDNSSSNRADGSPSKYGMRSSRRLNFLQPESEFNQDEDSKQQYNSNYNSEAEIENANENCNSHSSTDEANVDEDNSPRERVVARSRIDNHLVPSSEIFSNLIAETSCDGDPKTSEIPVEPNLKSLQEMESKRIETGLNGSTVHLNGRRSPVKVGKIAKLEKLRHMHSDPTARHNIGETHEYTENPTNMNRKDMSEKKLQDDKSSHDLEKQVYIEKPRRPPLTQNDYVYYDDAESDVENDLKKGDLHDESKRTLDCDVNEFEKSVNGFDGRCNREKRQTSKGTKYTVDEDFCADEFSDEKLSSDEELSEEEFEDDEENPWGGKKKRGRRGRREAEKKRKKPEVEPERVSSRLSSRTRVAYSEDPYADDVEKYAIDGSNRPPRTTRRYFDGL